MRHVYRLAARVFLVVSLPVDTGRARPGHTATCTAICVVPRKPLQMYARGSDADGVRGYA
jgi:hypothetical protein